MSARDRNKIVIRIPRQLAEHIGPDKAADVVAAWDRGDSIFTIEMGGLGPGYEQAIQVAMVELLRGVPPPPPPTGNEPTDDETKAWRAWGEDTLTRVNHPLGGLTGAMWGAAKSLAAQVHRNGMHWCLDQVPNDRQIQISKKWPRAETA